MGADEFVCNECSEKSIFTEINAYLVHKTLHFREFEETSNSCGTYICRICPQQFSRRSKLLMHYTLYHKVHGLNKSSCCSENKSLKLRKRNVDSKIGKFHLRPHTMAASKLAFAGNNSILLEQSTQKDCSLNEADDVVFGCLAAENGGFGNDFHFMLQSETISGASLKYLKSLLACIYCSYKCSVLLELTSHMQHLHPAIVSIPIDSQQVPRNGNPILRMSEYLQSTSNLLVNAETDGTPSIKERQTSLRCEFCNKHFTNKNYLSRHIDKQHITPSVFKCDLCEHTEMVKHKLNIHRQKHLMKEFRCKECDFVSTVKVAVQSHRQVHSSGSYICEICGKAYESRSTLQKHKQVHDKRRPFACTFTGCTLRFKTERMCKGHLKTHLGEGSSFPCTECGYSFRHKHHLKRHLESTHKISFVKTQQRLISADEISAYEIPVGEGRDPPLVNDSEATTFNLRNIILGGEAFELATQAGVEEPDSSSIILLKPNKASDGMYQEIIDTESAQQTAYNGSTLASVYITAQTNESNCENNLSQDATSSTVLKNAACCLSQSAKGTIAVSEDQSIPASCVVEYIAENDSGTRGMVFEEADIPATSDSLFN